jgi:hypothetical protein
VPGAARRALSAWSKTKQYEALCASGERVVFYNYIVDLTTETAMAKTKRAPGLALPRVARPRRSYEERTGLTSRAAKISLAAINDKPEFVEDEDGHRMRVWKTEELSSYSHQDIADALRGRHIVEREDLLETIPPSAIKYAVTKQWLRRDERGGWFYVTDKAVFELRLPRQVRGRRIQFAKAPR